MAWGVSNAAITKGEFHSSGLAAGYTYKVAQSWSGNNECITADDARNYICCNIALFSDRPYNQLLKYSLLARTYSYSFRYSATGCNSACTASYITYWSTDSVLTTNSLLYTDCQCTTEAPSGYYLNSSGVCYNYVCGVCGT